MSPKLGPMVSKVQKNIVKAHVADALKCGARCLYGGDGDGKAEGNFMPPTLLSDVPHSAIITRQVNLGALLPGMRAPKLGCAYAFLYEQSPVLHIAFLCSMEVGREVRN